MFRGMDMFVCDGAVGKLRMAIYASSGLPILYQDRVYLNYRILISHSLLKRIVPGRVT